MSCWRRTTSTTSAWIAGSGYYRDMIQIIRSSGTGSSEIAIRDNILDPGAGDYAQGIWAGGDKANSSDPTNWHKNIVLEGNVMYNAHANGFAIHMADGVTMRDNTLVAVPRTEQGGVTVPKIIVSRDSKNVTIEHNVTPAVVGENGQSDWNVQKRHRPEHRSERAGLLWPGVHSARDVAGRWLQPLRDRRRQRR